MSKGKLKNCHTENIIIRDCHPSFSLENVTGSSNYKIIKSGRSLDLAYQLTAMTRRDCFVSNDKNSLSYVREADNKNLLAGELDISFNLTQSTSPQSSPSKERNCMDNLILIIINTILRLRHLYPNA